MSERSDAESSGPSADHRLAAAIARRYYLRDESQVRIATDLGISRFKVARLLEWARKEGIVRIEIAEPEVDVALSKALASTLGVDRALVLDTVESDPRTSQIGVLTARHLASAVPPHGVLGLAWSRATQALTEHLQGIPDATVVQLCGVLTHAAGEEQSVELVRRAAANTGGKALTFYAPLVLDDAATAGSLRRQVGIIDVLRQCDSLSVAVIAVGMWAPGCSTVYDALSVHDRMMFAERGAVAESSGILFDASGEVLREGLQDRVVAVTEAQLRRAGEVVALATEVERIPAIYALTRSGIVSTLITHRQIAEHILADAGAR